MYMYVCMDDGWFSPYLLLLVQENVESDNTDHDYVISGTRKNVYFPFLFFLPPSFTRSLTIPTTIAHSYTYTTHTHTHTHVHTHSHTKILIHPHIDICTHKQDLYPTSLVLEPFSNDDETEAEGTNLEHEEKGIRGVIFNQLCVCIPFFFVSTKTTVSSILLTLSTQNLLSPFLFP